MENKFASLELPVMRGTSKLTRWVVELITRKTTLIGVGLTINEYRLRNSILKKNAIMTAHVTIVKVDTCEFAVKWHHNDDHQMNIWPRKLKAIKIAVLDVCVWASAVRWWMTSGRTHYGQAASSNESTESIFIYSKNEHRIVLISIYTLYTQMPHVYVRLKDIRMLNCNFSPVTHCHILFPISNKYVNIVTAVQLTSWHRTCVECQRRLYVRRKKKKRIQNCENIWRNSYICTKLSNWLRHSSVLLLWLLVVASVAVSCICKTN